jgi:hypothetical protein
MRRRLLDGASRRSGHRASIREIRPFVRHGGGPHDKGICLADDHSVTTCSIRPTGAKFTARLPQEQRADENRL